VASPHHPPTLHEALRSYGIKLILLIVLTGIPDPFETPLN